ncbi:f00b1a03-64c4-41ca-aa7f-f2bab56fd331 [Thermothielavioides terrestris]|uniref:F00b1a03-64c4-41ca-aa7f-f2bab56fd331 n=1 Tax=Thermothielavioides terrestris TaxID=2587410 RepID=A0A3S4D1P1_9PEZI|nr:f00b1a03-64c4-41ca-aa7f-f2bab56fd331 [Thermothielavioides terrestris]
MFSVVLAAPTKAFLTVTSEVLLHILASAGSLSDLQALAETSRRIHSIFQLEQSSLVYQVLANELGPVLADALGLSYIQALDALSPTFVEQAESAVSSYAQLLEAGGM